MRIVHVKILDGAWEAIEELFNPQGGSFPVSVERAIENSLNDLFPEAVRVDPRETQYID